MTNKQLKTFNTLVIGYLLQKGFKKLDTSLWNESIIYVKDSIMITLESEPDSHTRDLNPIYSIYSKIFGEKENIYNREGNFRGYIDKVLKIHRILRYDHIEDKYFNKNECYFDNMDQFINSLTEEQRHLLTLVNSYRDKFNNQKMKRKEWLKFIVKINNIVPKENQINFINYDLFNRMSQEKETK